jgi:hypothetical protein
MSELAKCPACGGDPVFTTEHDPYEGVTYGRVVCTHGGVGVENAPFRPISTIMHVPAWVAVESWNDVFAKKVGS